MIKPQSPAHSVINFYSPQVSIIKDYCKRNSIVTWKWLLSVALKEIRRGTLEHSKEDETAYAIRYPDGITKRVRKEEFDAYDKHQT
jgi:hypothetical protein